MGSRILSVFLNKEGTLSLVVLVAPCTSLVILKLLVLSTSLVVTAFSSGLEERSNYEAHDLAKYSCAP
jgi:hypothetical protein